MENSSPISLYISLSVPLLCVAFRPVAGPSTAAMPEMRLDISRHAGASIDEETEVEESPLGMDKAEFSNRHSSI